MKNIIYREHNTNIEHSIRTNDDKFLRYCLTSLTDDDNIYRRKTGFQKMMTIYLGLAVACFGFSFYEMIYNLVTGYSTFANVISGLHALPGEIASTGLFGIMLAVVVGFSLFRKVMDSPALLIGVLGLGCLASMGLLMPLVGFVTDYPMMLPGVAFMALSAHQSQWIFYLDKRAINLKAWARQPAVWFPVFSINGRKYLRAVVKQQPLQIEYDQFAFLKGGK